MLMIPVSRSHHQSDFAAHHSLLSATMFQSGLEVVETKMQGLPGRSAPPHSCIQGRGKPRMTGFLGVKPCKGEMCWQRRDDAKQQRNSDK